MLKRILLTVGVALSTFQYTLASDGVKNETEKEIKLTQKEKTLIVQECMNKLFSENQHYFIYSDKTKFLRRDMVLEILRDTKLTDSIVAAAKDPTLTNYLSSSIAWMMRHAFSEGEAMYKPKQEPEEKWYYFGT